MLQKEIDACEFSISAQSNALFSSEESLVLPQKYHNQIYLAECQAKYMLYLDAVDCLTSGITSKSLEQGKIFFMNSNYSLDVVLLHVISRRFIKISNSRILYSPALHCALSSNNIIEVFVCEYRRKLSQFRRKIPKIVLEKNGHVPENVVALMDKVQKQYRYLPK